MQHQKTQHRRFSFVGGFSLGGGGGPGLCCLNKHRHFSYFCFAGGLVFGWWRRSGQGWGEGAMIGMGGRREHRDPNNRWECRPSARQQSRDVCNGRCPAFTLPYMNRKPTSSGTWCLFHDQTNMGTWRVFVVVFARARPNKPIPAYFFSCRRLFFGRRQRTWAVLS